VMIHSNTVSDSKNFGIVADAGERDTDGQVANISTGLLVVVNAPISAIGDGFRPCGPESGLGPFFFQGTITSLCTPDVTDFIDFNTGAFSTDFAANLTPVRLQNPSPGPARNLVVENLPSEGGFAPGVIIANNTIQNEGLGGIHVSGQSRTFEIMPQRPPLFTTGGAPVYPLQTVANFTAGDMVNDGNLLIITAFGQTVTFEFEDIAGSPVSDGTRWAPNGSGVVCGDGYDEGHIPIFFRRTSAGACGVHPTISQGAPLGYNQLEMAWAIKDAIDSSPLVSNDSTLSVQAQVAWGRHPGGDDVFNIHGLPGPGPLGQDPVVYLEHVSNVEEVNRGGCTFSVPSPGCVVFVDRQLSIAVGPEPFTRVVNNTIFGNDGNYAYFPDPIDEPNDTIPVAIDTRQGRQHNPESFTSPTAVGTEATIGDTINFREDKSVDVDFYQFQLDIGDHVVIDVDALSVGSGLEAVLRLFSSVGEELTVSRGNATTGADPLIDFTATAPGTYYVGVSGAGNETYSPLSLSDRTPGASTGIYTIDINVRAPRQYLLVVEDGANYTAGQSFQIEDVAGNVATFVFGGGGGPGTFAIPLNAGAQNPDVARQIEQAINGAAGVLNNVQNLPNGSFGVANPLAPVIAEAFGGNQQERFGWELPGINVRAEGELFVIIRNVARFEDINSGIIFNPDPNNPLDPVLPDQLDFHEFQPFPDNNGRNDNLTHPQPNNSGPNDLDQIWEERGILISEQATPTVLNNVLANLRLGVEQVDFQQGSDGPVDAQRSVQGGMIEGGSLYQDTLFNSNLALGTGDFNSEIAGGAPLFVNAAAGSFYPAPFARSIDSSIDTLPDRDEFASIRESIGLSQSPLLAPDHDATGQLRVDDPNVDTPSGQGANVFKDRGSLDRSDFVGPSASLVNPQDNDSRGLDLDSAHSIVQLNEGVFANFSVQIVDGFESADPFPGIGVDDGTLDGRTVRIVEEGLPLDLRGPAVTIFQDGVFLREGIDYTFRFNRTSNTIVLAPLAGIWPDDKVYIIRVNNRDRFVLDAEDGRAALDGDSFTITNDTGDRGTYEFDKGFSLVVNRTLGLQVPLVGAGPGGIIDGQRFSINDGTRAIGDPVVFEFDQNGNWLSGNRRVPFSAGATADEIATAIVSALAAANDFARNAQGQLLAIQPNRLSVPLQPRNLGGGLVHVGAENVHRVDLGTSTLTSTITQVPVSLTVPTGGANAIQDNETFTVSDGTLSVTFELSDNGLASTVPGSIVIPFQPLDSEEVIAGTIAGFLANPRGFGNELMLNPVHVGNGIIQLGAQANHTVDVSNTSLTRQVSVGGVRDGEVITLRNTSTVATIEFDNDGVFGMATNNSVISFSARDTHLDLAARITSAIRGAGVGLNPVDAGNGEINVGGLAGVHNLIVSQPSSLTVVGAPGASPSTTLVLPSLPGLQVDPAGAAAFTDGEFFTISNAGTTAVFEFDDDGIFVDLDNDTIPDNKIIALVPGTSQSVLGGSLAMAISEESLRLGLGLNPTTPTSGVIALNAQAAVNLFSAGLTTKNLLGTLNDGEMFTIDDGSRVVTFEFEDLNTSNGVSGTNTPITFLPASFVEVVAASTAAALSSANIGLNPSLPAPGTGLVELGDSPRHLTDISNTSLMLIGVPGGAFPIDIRSNFTESQTAAAIVAGINATNGSPAGISAAPRGGSTLFVDISDAAGDPANFISGFTTVDGIDNFFLNAVKDLAGNSLKANQSTDETVFTILLPGVGLDFGDAPDPFAGSGNYPTLFDSNGARHVIGDTLYLGRGIDAERDASQTLAADGDDSDHSIQLLDANISLLGAPPFSVQVPAAGGAAISEGETFTITRFGTSVTFEFSADLSIAATSDVRVPFTATNTANEIASAVVEAVVVKRVGHPRYPNATMPPLENRLSLVPTNLGNGIVSVGGAPALNIGVANSGFSVTDAPLLQLVLPLRLVVSDGSSIADEDQFSVSNGVTTVTFEFDKGSGVSSGVVPINLTGTESLDAVAATVIAAVESVFAELSGEASSGMITFSGIGPGHAIVIINASTLAVDRSVASGDSIVINDGIHATVVFEVSVDNAPVAPGHVVIDISSGATDAEVSEAIRSTVKGQQSHLTGLSPRVHNDHTITLAHHRNDTFDLSASSLTHANRAPVSLLTTAAGLVIEIPSVARLRMPASGGAGIADGDFFTISDGINPPLRFEFDDDGSFNGILLRFNDLFTTQNLVELVLAAIQTEIAAGRLTGVAPIDLGAGVIDLRPLARVRVDATGTNGTIQQTTGVSDGDAFQIDDRIHAPVTFEFDLDGNGVSRGGALPINVRLGDSANDIAKKLEAAIKGATLTPNVLGSPDKPVVPVSIGNGVVDLSTAEDVQLVSFGTPQYEVTGVPGGIADGQRFTVSDGNRTWTFEFDRNGKFVENRIRIPFASGDDANAIGASLSDAINSTVSTLAASDLGDGVVLLQVADEDGVRFDSILVPGKSTPITVTSSGTGFLDAWFDFNHDGDWNDPGEQVLQNAIVHAGENSLSVAVPQVLPSNSPLGETYARFRISSAGSLLPTGLAVDGEVEDYKVRILDNPAPFVKPAALVDLITAEDSDDTVIDLFNPQAFDDVNLTDGNGDVLTLSVGTRVLSVKQDGATLRDGDTITIFTADEFDSRTFEFDRDGAVASGNVAVPFTIVASAAEIAASLASRIESQAYGLNTSLSGASILLIGEGSIVLGPVFSGITVSTGLALEILQAGATFQDGGTVTIVAANNLESRTFEFDNDGLNAAGNVAVQFDSTATRADLAAALIAEINRIANDPSENYSVVAVAGIADDGVVRLGGQASIFFGSILDGIVETSDATLRVLQDGLNFTEAGTVTITSTQGAPRTFEFTSDGIVTPGNILVVYDTTRTPEQIAGTLALAITNASFGVVATIDPLDATLVRLSGTSNVALGIGFGDLAIGTGRGLELREDGAALPDKATVKITTADGLATRTFEFDSNGSVTRGNLPVVFGSSSTMVEIMDRLAAQIATAKFGVVATSDPLNGAILRLSGSGAVTFDIDFEDLRLVSDAPILIPSIDIDGQTLRLDYQPDQNGIVNVTVRATDQGGLFAERTFQVEVAPGNDEPVATGVVDATLVTPSGTCQVTFSDLNPRDGFAETIDLCEDHAIAVTLRGDDGDPLPLERQRLTFENFDQSNANGTITSITSDTGDLETGQFVFIPNVNFNGTGVIVFTVRDDGSAGVPFQQQSTPFTLTLNVASVNDPPTGTDQVGTTAVSTTEDTSVTITLAGDDDGNTTTSEVQNLTFTIVGFPTHGTFISGVATDGTITAPVVNNTVTIEYLPDRNFNNNANSPVGPDSFTFNVTDDGTPPETSVAPATVQINVSAVNDAPIPEVLLATTTTSTICQPSPGALVLGADLTQIVDTCEDHVTTLTLGGSTGDDESSQTLTFMLVSGPNLGTLGAITPTTPTQATAVYTPPMGFNGTTTFVVRATDNGQTDGNPAPLSDELTVTINVQSVNAAPIANDQAVTTPEVNAKAITLTADDGDPGVAQTLRYFVLAGPDNSISRTANGTLSGVNTITGEVIGQLVYTPDLNYNGMDSFTFEVQDDGLAGNPPNRFSNVATVDITVTPVNDPPIANGQSVVTNEDTTIVVALTGDDGDPTEIQTLSYEIAATPAKGSLNTADILNGNVSYTPSANFNGTDTFTFRVRDNGTNPANLLSTPATVTVTINPLNDAPQFTIGQPLTVLEDSGSQTLIAWASGIRPGPTSASDEAGQIVSFTTTNDNPSLFLASGQPTVSSSGTLTYTPAPNAVGLAAVTVVAMDSGSGVGLNVNTSVAQTVALAVSPVNDAPQFIKGPNQSTNEDGGLQTIPAWASNIAPGPVQAVDESTQGLEFLVSVATTGNLEFEIEPTISTAVGTRGQLSYQPKAHTNGTATVSVTLRDAGDGTPPNINISPTETFSITVNPINDAPEFTAGADVPVNEDAGLVRITRWATGIRPGPVEATDENSQALTFIANTVGFTDGLTFTTAPLVDPLTGDLVFQTSPNKWGTATVTVRLRDTGPGTSPHDNESNIHTLTISVAAVNDPPEFTLGANQQLTEDAIGQTVFGFASSIRPGPVSANDEAGQSVNFVTTNDNNSLFATQPAVSANGTLSYTPAPNENGVAVLTVDGQDSGSNLAPSRNSAAKKFTITISAVNDAPTLTVPGPQTVAEDVLKAIGGIVAADIDVAEGTGRVQVEFRATNGILNLNTNTPGGVLAGQVTANGSSAVSVLAPLAQINATLAHLNSQSEPDGFTYRGKPNVNGQDQIVITVDDLGNTGSPGGRTVSRTVLLTVTPVNDPPILANPIADITVNEDAPVTIVELFPQVFNDPDVLSNNDRLTLQVVDNSNPLVASTVINNTALSITPVSDASGETLITVEASDLSGEFVRNTFRFVVLPVNDAPTAVNDSYTVPGSAPTVLPVLSNDSDKDSVINPSTVAIVSAASGGGVAVNGNGTITFTANVGFRGKTTFTYTVNDAQGATSQPATVTVTVNEPPIAGADAATTNQGVAVAIPVLANDTDTDGSIVTTSVAIAQQPANGSVFVNPTGVITYTPNLAFSGTDTFRYTVKDDIGGVSAPATVTVTVVPFRPWQNPADQAANGADGALDVNADGFVSPIDVLLIVNRINTQGAGPLPDPTAGNSPPPYYDTNGDGQLTPIDALLVINFLKGAGSVQAEGESVGTQVDVLAATDTAGAAAVLVSEFTPGYRQSRYSASSEMPPVLHDELVAPWSVANRMAADLLAERNADRYRDGIHSSREDAYRVGADLDDVLADLAWDHASDDELLGHDRLADAALTDLLEQDLLSGDN